MNLSLQSTQEDWSLDSFSDHINGNKLNKEMYPHPILGKDDDSPLSIDLHQDHSYTPQPPEPLDHIENGGSLG